MKRIVSFALALFLLGLASAARAAENRFTLTETRSQSSYGPFTLFDGARIRLAGTLYTLSISPDGRLSFTAPDGKSHGPYQPVAGRIMQVGDAMYSYNAGGASSSDRASFSSAGGASSSDRASFSSAGGAVPRQRGLGQSPSSPSSPSSPAPIATFDPLPPKPELIEIPPEIEHRKGPVLDLPALPDASRAPYWSLWVAPVDTTPFDWKIESVSGKETDLKRTTFGGGLAYNSWLAEATLSTSGKSSAIVPSGLGFSGSSIEDASGFSFSAGYKRPFLKEGGWTASAGLLGRIRQDKGDISSTALVATGEADTNDVGNVISKYESRKSSIKLTETTLRLDFDLTYRSGHFLWLAGLQVQPVSSVSVSGKLPYGDDGLKISAKHDDAVGAIAGGSYTFDNGLSVFADLTLIYETRLRIGLSCPF